MDNNSVAFSSLNRVCRGHKREAAGYIFNVLRTSYVSKAGYSILAKMALWFHIHGELLKPGVYLRERSLMHPCITGISRVEGN